MHCAAIVPDDEIADSPAVPVDELRLGRKSDQLLDQRPALLDRPADDVRGVRGEVEAGAAGVAVVTDQRLPHRCNSVKIASLKSAKPIWLRERKMLCSTTSPSSPRLRASGSASQAARISANSVSPPPIGPGDGSSRAESSEHFAGMRLNELSVCQSWLPRLNRLRRSSRASTRPSGSRLEMSATSARSRILAPA